MKAIDLKFIKSWSVKRKDGRWRFALRTGVIWSMLTAFLTKIFELSRFSFSEVYLNGSFLKYLASFIIIGTMIFWKFIWEMNEKKYDKLLKEQEDESNG